MSVLSISANDPRAIMARAGVGMLRRLANVELVIDGNPAICGWKRVSVTEPVVGGVSVQSSVTEVTCLAADLPTSTDIDSTVRMDAVNYRVALIDPNAPLGWMVLVLREV